MVEPECLADDIGWEAMALASTHGPILSIHRANLAIPIYSSYASEVSQVIHYFVTPAAESTSVRVMIDRTKLPVSRYRGAGSGDLSERSVASGLAGGFSSPGLWEGNRTVRVRLLPMKVP